MKCLDTAAMRQIMTPLNYMHRPAESRTKTTSSGVIENYYCSQGAFDIT